MAKESDFQAKVIKKLKSLGLAVVKNQAGPGVPTGFPDLTAFGEGIYFCLECKASARAKKQPRQDYWVNKLNEWSYAAFIYPSNYDKVMSEIKYMVGK
jgi:Holliday junction resolvase